MKENATHLSCLRLTKRNDLIIVTGAASLATDNGPLLIQLTRGQNSANSERWHPRDGDAKHAGITYLTAVHDTAMCMASVVSHLSAMMHDVWEENVEGDIQGLHASPII